HGWDVRVGHVGNKADTRGEEAGILLGARNALGKFGAERAADGGDVHANLFEHLAGHLATHAAAAGLPRRVGAVPWRVGERGVGAGVALDLLERGADAVTKRFEPIARGLL